MLRLLSRMRCRVYAVCQIGLTYHLVCCQNIKILKSTSHYHSMKQTILLFISIFILGSVHAQDQLLKGTFGDAPVVLNLTLSGSQAEATYFFTATCVDVTLLGTRSSSGNIVLALTRRNYKATGKGMDTTEKLQLKQNADKSWTGTWAGNKGKKANVKLISVDLAATPHPFGHLDIVKEFRQLDGYEYMRSASIPLVRDPELVTVGRYKLQYFHLKNTQIRTFYIVDGLEKTVGNKVNALMMDKFIGNVCDYGSCTATVGDPNYTYTIDNLFLSAGLLSMNVTVQYYCRGGAYPEADEEPITINLKTGDELELEDLLHLTDIVPPTPETPKWKQYREMNYAPKLLDLLKSIHAKNIADKENCDYSVVTRWALPQWYVTTKGLYISPMFPHAIAPCRNPTWSYIPFDVLKKYKTPGKNIVVQ